MSGPMTEPREALAAAVLDACQNTASMYSDGEPRDDREWSLDVADRLIAAGVHLGDEGLREAAQAVATLRPAPDACMDSTPNGQELRAWWFEFVVARLDLRAALAVRENPEARP